MNEEWFVLNIHTNIFHLNTLPQQVENEVIVRNAEFDPMEISINQNLLNILIVNKYYRQLDN